MTKHASVFSALAIVALGATAADAQIKKYGSEAGWDIFVNDNLGPGCVIAKKLSPEVQLLMGVDASGGQKVGYMALYTKAGANVTEGQQLAVSFDVDGQQFSAPQPLSRCRASAAARSRSTTSTSSTVWRRSTP